MPTHARLTSLAVPSPVRPYLSVVVPLFNEAPTLSELHNRLTRVLRRMAQPYEIVFVDDGSRDGTSALLKRISGEDPAVRPVVLARNYGQTAALAAGFDRVRGQVIIAMDGDLQHEPEDMPRFVAKLEEGYDVVSGWREKRRDGLWTRRIPSRVANWLMSKVSGVRLHDFGTTFKAYRRQVIRRIALHGELHRFIPALASLQGARIAEVPIANPPRPHAKSHYGLSRTWRVMSDLLTVRFLLRYATRPLHLFGPLAFLSLALGCVGAAVVLAQKLVVGGGVFLSRGPLLLTSVMLLSTGINLLAIGLVAELLVRVYYDGKRHRIYAVRRAPAIGHGEKAGDAAAGALRWRGAPRQFGHSECAAEAPSPQDDVNLTPAPVPARS
jgi:glycosyltransferase involved in cell wall biosynthesis